MATIERTEEAVLEEASGRDRWWGNFQLLIIILDNSSIKIKIIIEIQIY